MGAITPHDYIGRVREEAAALATDLADEAVRISLTRVSQRLALSDELSLAAVYRAARRSGLSLRLMLDELNGQLDQTNQPGR